MVGLIFRILIPAILLLAPTAQGAVRKTLRISTPNDGSAMTATKEFIRKSYDDIGYNVVFKDRPADKALEYLENETFDGDLVRTKVVEKPSAILKVNVSLAKVKVYMVSKKDRTAPRDLKEIKKGDKGAILFGYPLAKAVLDGRTTVITRVTTNPELESLLKAGEADFVITIEKFKDPKEQFIQKIVFTEDVYHVVSAKRKHPKRNLPLIPRSPRFGFPLMGVLKKRGIFFIALFDQIFCRDEAKRG